jgi:hypothetical protein
MLGWEMKKKRKKKRKIEKEKKRRREVGGGRGGTSENWAGGLKLLQGSQEERPKGYQICWGTTDWWFEQVHH